MIAMPYTAAELVVLMGAFFAGIALVIKEIKARRIEDGIARVQQTAAVIEGHVNSAATAARLALEAGIEREAALQATIERLERTAVALAAATAKPL